MEPRPWDEGFLRRAWEQAWHIIGKRWVKVCAFLVVGVGIPALGALAGAMEAVIALTVVSGFFLCVLAINIVRAPFLQRDEARADRLRLIEHIDAVEGRTRPMPDGFVTVRRAVKQLVETREKGLMGAGAMALELACDGLVEAARNDYIKIWGHTKISTVYEPIPKSYWNMSRIDSLDLLAEDGSSGRTKLALHTTGYRTYLNLCVSLDSLKCVWPEDQRRLREGD